ncbi:Fc.00g052750.m01.CDS01 [Cosmosporella sp. VM-42]
MAPTTSKANYKSYEAQARMVRAIVAAHPEVKWNYKEIVACYGSDMTADALNHRFRRLNAQAVIIRDARVLGFDMKDMDTDDKVLPATQKLVEKNNIAKYFGQSTADGIQFQFRGIKRDAETLRKVDRDGGDVANCLPLGSGTSAPATPSKAMSAKKVGGSRTGTTGKRARTTFIKSAPSDEEDEEEDEVDWEDQDNTPSKRVKSIPRSRKAGTPSRLAAVKADATIAESFSQLQASESPPEIPTPTSSAPIASAPPASIFGEVERKPVINYTQNLIPSVFTNSAFSGNGTDEYFGGNPDESYNGSFTYSSFNMGGNGEI